MPAAESRVRTPLTEWQFTASATVPAGDASWAAVVVPHIFRQSGLPDNAVGWYRRTLTVTPADLGRRTLLELEGAATISEVFVDGHAVGRHVSPYTAWSFDLTPMLTAAGDHRLEVRVDNRDEQVIGCFARSTLYTVNGGLFRKAWLVTTGAVSIEPDQGSSGVYLTPRIAADGRGTLGMGTVVRNLTDAAVRVTVRHEVRDPTGIMCAHAESAARLAAGEVATLAASTSLSRPQCWAIRHPALYTVTTVLLHDGVECDRVTERTGFRTIIWQDGRFRLNSEEVQFRGVNKHAQNEYAWNAVGDDELRWEWQQMDELGVNAVRLAHYPHSHLEYDLADEHGLAVWAENGFAGHAWKGAVEADKAVTPDGERLTREMVRQNWNHPSILFWSCGNETIAATADHYAQIIKAEDDSRIVAYASESKDPKRDPPHVQFVARNTYDGWYSGVIADFARKPVNTALSETGCGDWITHHVPAGKAIWKVNRFEPEEYAELFAEYRLQTVCRDDAANRPLFMWWTFREFYDRKFKQNRNSKGLLTMAGMPKDICFAFQAFLNPARSVVHLNGRHHVLRRFAADDGIKAYANVAELELRVNGVSQGRQRNGAYRMPDLVSPDGKRTDHGITVANVFWWQPRLVPGRNLIEVDDGAGHHDQMVVYQTAADGTVPHDPQALVLDLHSDNPTDPAVYLDRPIEAQGPVYTPVDGSADNTFDRLPAAVVGSSWIGTGRQSAPGQASGVSFRINPVAAGAQVAVLASTGTFPLITGKETVPATVAAAERLGRALVAAGFTQSAEPAVWRDHDLTLADARLWTRTCAPGDAIAIPAPGVDAVVLVKRLP